MDVGTPEIALQVFPNPFQTHATLQFQVPQTEKVRVAVYSMTGAEVALLFDGQAQAHEINEVAFDIETTARTLYLVRMVTESGHVQVRKVIGM